MSIGALRRSACVLAIAFAASCSEKAAKPNPGDADPGRGAASSQSPDPAERAKAAQGKLQRRRARRGSSELKTAFFGWSYKDRAQEPVEMLAAIRRNQTGSVLRIERKQGGKTRVYKASDGSYFEQLDEGVRSVSAEEGAVLARLHLLLGSLLLWDLDAGASLDGTRLVSRARWWHGSKSPEVHRLLGREGQVLSLDLRCPEGSLPSSPQARDFEFRSSQELPGRGGRVPILEGEACSAFLMAAKPGSRSLSWTRYDVGASLRDAYFALEASPSGERSDGLIEYGGERRNFERALLEAVPAVSVLAVPDPGPSWKARCDKLVELGKQLHGLGREPAGLPAYFGGKMHVYLKPSDGKPAKTPEGLPAKERKAGHALVLHCLANLEAAKAILGPRLKAEATRRKLALAGPLRLIAFVLPGSEIPASDAAICIRGELPVR